MWIKKTEYFLLNKRIKELENRLCPFNSHDYIITNEYFESDCCGGIIDCWTIRVLECSKCGHKTEDGSQLGFKYNSRKMEDIKL